MSRISDELAKWAVAQAAAGWTTKTLARRIAAAGPPHGEYKLTKPMSEPLAVAILAMLRECGLGSSDARKYAVDLFRWHLGYETAPVASGLTQDERAFVRRRVWETIEHYRDRLPALTNDRPAT